MNNINWKIFDGIKHTLTFSIIQYIIFILIQIIFARTLSPEIFGEFAMISITVMFFFTLSNFCTDKLIIVDDSLSESKYNSLVSFDIIYSTLIYLIFYLLITNHLIPIINYDYINYILLFGLIVFFHPFSRNKAILEKELKFFKARFPSALAAIFASIVSLYVIWKGHTILALIIWKLTQYIFEVIILFAAYPRKIKIEFNRLTMKELIKFSSPLILSNIIIFFYWNIDYVIVDKLLGKEQLGFYWLAFQLGLFILRIKDAFINVIFPVYSRERNKEIINKNFNELSKMTIELLGIVFLLFLFFGKEIFTLTFGVKWLPALSPFIVTIVLSILRSFTSFFEPIILINKKTNIKLILSIFNAILVPVLVFFMVKNYGLVGAPLGVLFINILSTFLLIIMTRTLVSINFSPILKICIMFTLITLANHIFLIPNILKISILIILTVKFISDGIKKIKNSKNSK